MAISTSTAPVNAPAGRRGTPAGRRGTPAGRRGTPAGGRLFWTFLVTSIAAFMVSLDNLVVTNALP